MPAIVAAFGSILLWALGSFIGRLIVGLGVGVVAYQGVDQLVSVLTSQINSALGGIDPAYTEALSVFGFFQAVNILTSAYIARFGTQTAYRLALRRAS